MKKTPQQIQNLKNALVWWKIVPEKNVAEYLGSWRQSRPWSDDPSLVSCSTVCCFGGWACLRPELQAQGLRPDKCGVPQLYSQEGACIGNEWAASRVIYGSSRLFNMRGSQDAYFGDVSDHQLVTLRIKAALAEPEQT